MPKTAKTRPGLKVVKRPGSASLYLRGTVAGQRIFESAGTDDRAIAEERRAAREVELHRAAIYGVKPTTTFAAAVESYLKTGDHSQATKLRVGRVLRHFGPTTTCEAIDQVAIDRACDVLCRANSLPSSKLREVTAPVKAVLTHAARRGWCNIPLFEVVKSGRKRTDWMKPAQAEAMIACAPPHSAAWLVFFFCTGARVNEMVCLEWPDVDLAHARAMLRDTKNGTDRIVDLTPRAVAVLTALSAFMISIGRRSGRVFRDRHGQPYRDTNDSATMPYGGQLRDEFKAILTAAGVPQTMVPHHMRHSWATYHYAIHRDPMRLRDDGGWKSISLVERYAKLAPNGMQDEIQRLWGYGANLVHIDTKAQLTA